MRCLITGGAGFVGSNIAKALLERGFTVSILDDLSRVGTFENLKWLENFGEFSHHKFSVVDKLLCEKLVADFKPETVLHLAGQVAMTTSVENPYQDFLINTAGTLNLLESLRIYSPECRVIYASTNKVYGNLSQIKLAEMSSRFVPSHDMYRELDESLSLDFCSPYGCSKGSADQYVRDYHTTFGLPTIVFRHSTIYGGRQLPTYAQGWVGWFCKQANIASRDPNHRFSISGNGKQVRDILHVSDVVRLYENAIQAPEEAFGEAFNVGGGHLNSISILELLDMLSNSLGFKLPYYHIPERLGDQKYYVSSTIKAEKTFNWMPETGYKKGITDMILSSDTFL